MLQTKNNHTFLTPLFSLPTIMATERSTTVHLKDRIVEVSNLLTPKECADLIEQCEAKGYKPSPVSGGGHGRTGREGARTSQFCVKDDDAFALMMWERVKAFVPKDLKSIKPVPYMNLTDPSTQGDEYTAVGVNPHLRFYKYDIGQYILKHDDYRMSRYRYDPKTDSYFYQITFFTLLLYLNEGFEGGQTCFWTKYATEGSSGHCRFLRGPDESKFAPHDLEVAPRTGYGLLQDHMIQHEGRPPSKARKYILRTDILHEKPVTKDRVTMKMRKGQLFSEWQRHYEPSCLHYTE